MWSAIHTISTLLANVDVKINVDGEQRALFEFLFVALDCGKISICINTRRSVRACAYVCEQEYARRSNYSDVRKMKEKFVFLVPNVQLINLRPEKKSSYCGFSRVHSRDSKIRKHGIHV